MKAGQVNEGEFLQKFAEYFDLPEGQLSLAEELVNDLGFDSLLVFEVFVMLEEVADHQLPDELAASLRTVGDVWFYFVQFGGAVALNGSDSSTVGPSPDDADRPR